MTLAQKIGEYADTTELVFILDRSGSMAGLEPETIGGYNSLLAKQREEPGECRVTTVLFDHQIDVLNRDVDIKQLRPMTRRQYKVRGCTALLDAVGLTIKRVNRAQKARPDGRPDRTIFVVTTDGMENASEIYGLAEVRKMIKKRKRKNDWEFIFLGANIDAVETAEGLGIDASRAATYVADECGTAVMFAGASAALSSIRYGKAPTGEWKEEIERDTAERG